MDLLEISDFLFATWMVFSSHGLLAYIFVLVANLLIGIMAAAVTFPITVISFPHTNRILSCLPHSLASWIWL